jgi:hypothetical protein
LPLPPALHARAEGCGWHFAVIDKEPEFSALFMKHLLTRNSRVEEDLIDQLFKVRNGSLAFSSCLQILEKKVTPRRSIQASIMKR